jgi:hypothetical protein
MLHVFLSRLKYPTRYLIMTNRSSSLPVVVHRTRFCVNNDGFLKASVTITSLKHKPIAKHYGFVCVCVCVCVCVSCLTKAAVLPHIPNDKFGSYCLGPAFNQSWLTLQMAPSLLSKKAPRKVTAQRWFPWGQALLLNSNKTSRFDPTKEKIRLVS